jgi:hypothetical protein
VRTFPDQMGPPGGDCLPKGDGGQSVRKNIKLGLHQGSGKYLRQPWVVTQAKTMLEELNGFRA